MLLAETRGSIRDELRKERDDAARLRREKAALRIQRDEEAWNNRSFNIEEQWRNALLFSAVNGQVGYMRNIGLTQPVNASVATDFSAYTNYSSITMSWKASTFPTFAADYAEITRTMVLMRAVLQHEIGHLRFSMPWERIPNNAATMQTVHNVLEDQRMECLVVEEVPTMANYFLPMVNDIVLHNQVGSSAWLYIAGRTYLPRDLRQLAFDLFDQYMADKLNVLGAAAEYERLVAGYKSAATPGEIYSWTEAVYSWLLSHKSAVHDSAQGHDTLNVPTAEPQMPVSASARSSIEDLLNMRSQSGNMPSFTDVMAAAADKAVGDLAKDKSIDRDISRANQAAGRSGLGESARAGRPMTAPELLEAESISEYIERAMTSFVTDSAPRWENRQTAGVIDALAFRTKDVGDKGFYRALAGDRGNGLDVHVSVLADNSGSMDHGMTALSQFMYGAATACDRLGITKTMVLWSDEELTHRVWETAVEDEIFNYQGGTHPIAALDDLDNHNEGGKSHHLVMVFTDGAWGAIHLNDWNRPDRTIIYIGYKQSTAVSDFGAHEHIFIKNLDELGPALASSLTRALS